MQLLNKSTGVVVLVAMVACSTEAQSPREPAPTDVVATVGGASITLAEVDEPALKLNAGSFGSLTLAQAIYEARRGALEEMIGTRLLDQEAKARGIDRATLTKAEIDAKVTVPTELDVAAWYRANPSRVQGAPLDQVAAPIRSLLTQERSQAAREDFLDALKAKTAVKVPRSRARGRTDRGDRVFRFPMPVLLTRPPHGGAGDVHVRR